MTKQLATKSLLLSTPLSSQRIISQAKLAGNEECKVLYNSAKDIVELEVGGTSLRFAAANFFMMNEMMRKAAAKLVMQTELRHSLNVVESKPVVDKKMPAKNMQLNALQHA